MRRRGVMVGLAMAIALLPSVAHASGPGWTVASTPIPSGAQGSFFQGIACPSANSCIAVGRFVNASGTTLTLAERLKRGAWKITPTVDPAGAASSMLQSVACTSASACIAVGGYTNASGTGLTLAEIWNGTSWALQTTPNPSGTTTAALLGVSCTSSSACEAVGYATNSSNVTSTLAMRWNGTSWSAQATPNPSGQPVSELLSVSCATATACTAAGYAGTSANDSSTLAERWNGSSWALQVTPNPSGATVSNLNGVSCATVSLCMAVGSSGPSPISAAPLSELWNGTAWTIETNLATTAAFDAVACVSATACTAVGTLNGRARGPYVEVWNGSVWASRSSVDPIVGGPAVLTGVACTSASTCTAAGFYSTGSNVHTVLVESGPSWTTGAPVEPKGATTSGFTGISCASTATCIAVGYDDNGTGQVNLAERLKGGRWKILPTPNPSGATTSYLQGVSCPGASACEAVGAFGTNSGGGALAEVWNGTAWALQTVPNPAGASGVLQAVSCTSSSACLAVGYENTPSAQLGFAAKWNGSVWSALAVPSPAGAQDAMLTAVSCTSSTACEAVGSYVTGGGPLAALAESWNGTAWSIQPVTAPSGAGQTFLFGVSCTTGAACTAVGSYDASSGVRSPLVERWNGSSWLPQGAALPDQATNLALQSVSCGSATVCTAVGQDLDPTNTQVTLIEGWNGTTWSLQPSANPDGAPQNTLLGVSCPAATVCVAVGNYEDSSGTQRVLVER